MLLLCVIIGIIYYTGIYKEISLQNIQNHLNELRSAAKERPALFISQFMGVYILLTSLAIPGTIVLTFLGGAIFGVVEGSLIVTLSATIGASISFLLSRYLFRDYITKNFKSRFVVMDRKFRAHGKYYLLNMRVVPISPFVCINILMGLTTIDFISFVWITFLGMLPGTSVYVFAGQQISSLKETSDIFTPSIVLTLMMIGILPFIFKKIRPHEKHT